MKGIFPLFIAWFQSAKEILLNPSNIKNINSILVGKYASSNRRCRHKNRIAGSNIKYAIDPFCISIFFSMIEYDAQINAPIMANTYPVK